MTEDKPGKRRMAKNHQKLEESRTSACLEVWDRGWASVLQRGERISSRLFKDPSLCSFITVALGDNTPFLLLIPCRIRESISMTLEFTEEPEILNIERNEKFYESHSGWGKTSVNHTSHGENTSHYWRHLVSLLMV